MFVSDYTNFNFPSELAAEAAAPTSTTAPALIAAAAAAAAAAAVCATSYRAAANPRVTDVEYADDAAVSIVHSIFASPMIAAEALHDVEMAGMMDAVAAE